MPAATRRSTPGLAGDCLKCCLMLRSSKVVQISSRVATVGERSRKTMPKLLYARTPQDTLEEQKVRKLANSRHAPSEWIVPARMIVLSWSALRTREIAVQLGCHPQRRCANVSTASTLR